MDSIVIDFKEKTVSKIAFARTREEAEELEKQYGMKIYFPSEIANFGEYSSIFVLADFKKERRG